jgi:hypothetical protein
LQLFAVQRATQGVALETLDGNRGPLLMVEYRKTGIVSTPQEMRLQERFEWPFFANRTLDFKLKVGGSISCFSSAVELEKALEQTGEKPFLMHQTPRKVTIVLHERATEMDALEAVFELCCPGENFEKFVTILSEKGWDLREQAWESTSQTIRGKW